MTLEAKRLQCAQLESELDKMRKALVSFSYQVDPTLHNDLTTIMSNNTGNITPFMNLFWQEQKQMSTVSGTGVRYHPMIIRFCLSLVAKSRSAYEEMRQCNILTLPSTRILRDYKNFIKPETGFHNNIIDGLNMITKGYFGIQRYIVLLFDEKK